MSLDVSLIVQTPVKRIGTGVFVRENGQRKELTVEEVNSRYPNANVKEFEEETTVVFEYNITHNLGRMADEAGLYEALWRPENIMGLNARTITLLLQQGLTILKGRKRHFLQFEAPNGWGRYEDLVKFVEEYLEACKKYPDAQISVCR